METFFPLGACEKHGPRLTVNGVPTCIRCKADQDNANRVLVVNDAQDPGAEFFQKGVTAVAKPSNTPVTAAQHVPKKQAGTAYTLESGLNEILSILEQIPMPKSMKQYKLLMAVKQKIESALQEG